MFHRMGMIATVTPGTSSTRTILCVTVTAENIAAFGHVNIEHYMSEFDGLQFVYYQKLQEHDVEDHTANGDLMWNISLSLRSP